MDRASYRIGRGTRPRRTKTCRDRFHIPPARVLYTVKRGAVTRFEQILRRHEEEIYRFARRMTGNTEDAADVLQETFLRAFRAFAGLPREANHRAWLYRIAGRTALNLARANRTREALPLQALGDLPEHRDDVESTVESRRLARSLAQTVRALPGRQRIALVLRKYEGLPYDEVAAALGCSADTARAHVYQAMTKIRRDLGGATERGGRRSGRS